MQRAVQKAPSSMGMRESEGGDVDLPLFQLSLADEQQKVAKLTEEEEEEEFAQFEQPASMLQFSHQVTYVGKGEGSSAAVIEVDEPGARSLFSSPVSKPHTLPPTSASSLSPTSAPGAAATDLFRRLSPKPVLIPESRSVFDFQAQPTNVAGADSAANEDLFQTSIPFPSFLSTVSSSAFDDRYEFEVELLQQMSSTSEEHAKLFLEATVNGKMMKKNRYSNVIPSQ